MSLHTCDRSFDKISGDSLKANSRHVSPFDDTASLKQEFIAGKMEDPSFVTECKLILEDELRRNWSQLLESSPSQYVRDNVSRFRNAQLQLFCVDSEFVDLYDSLDLVTHINNTISNGRPIEATVKALYQESVNMLKRAKQVFFPKDDEHVDPSSIYV